MIKSFFMNLSIKGKLSLFFLFASIIPLLSVSIYSYTVTNRQLISQTYENMNTMNNQINNNIENRLNNYKQISSLLYMDKTLQGYLSQSYTKDIQYVEAYDYINSLLYGVMASNADIAAITLYPYRESIPSDGVFVKYIDDALKNTSWYRELTQSSGDVVYSGGSNDRHEAVFTLARLLNNRSLQYPYGILTIDLKESVLYSLFEKETQTKAIYVVNRDGVILSAANKQLLASRLTDAIGQGVWNEQAGGTETAFIDGKQSLVVFNSTSLGWKTVSVVPFDYVLADAKQASARVLLISSLSALLAVFLIFFTARYFSNRFQKLYQFIRKVENEDFRFEIKSKGKDEIGQLTVAFNDMRLRLNDLINEVYKKEIMKKEAELYALQSQISPHFLYNTLSIISSLAIRNHDAEVETVVSHLSNFYKTSLNKGKRNILIQKELEITRHYLAIQQIRFDALFRVHWQTDEALYPYHTLKLMLQPFVENSINHAIWDDSAPLNIVIRLYRQADQIVFEVVDDGAGMSEQRIKDVLSPHTESGYGIRNVHERVQLAYGSRYGVTLFSKRGIGTQVKIVIPLE